MTKRLLDTDCEKELTDKLFDISNNIFVSVGIFHKKTLIQVRKFSGGLRTKIGVTLYPDEFEKVLKQLPKTKKIVNVGRFTLVKGSSTLKIVRNDGKEFLLPDECILKLTSFWLIFT